MKRNCQLTSEIQFRTSSAHTEYTGGSKSSYPQNVIFWLTYLSELNWNSNVLILVPNIYLKLRNGFSCVFCLFRFLVNVVVHLSVNHQGHKHFYSFQLKHVMCDINCHKLTQVTKPRAARQFISVRLYCHRVCTMHYANAINTYAVRFHSTFEMTTKEDG